MKKVLVFLLIITTSLFMAWHTGYFHYFNLETLKADSQRLQLVVTNNYWSAVLTYLGTYIAATMCFLPFVVLLTVVGGFLFGTWPGAVYANVAATIGSMGAFLLVRYLVGNLVQERYKHQLARFNKAMKEGEISYLLAIHFIAIVPFPVVNLLAALTQVRLWTFVWTTSVGILPGGIVSAFAGRQLRTIQNIHDIFSLNIAIAFVLLAIIALLPLIIQRMVRRT